MKILIVDDSAFMRGILKEIIAKSNWNGSTIIEADNGTDAIKQFSGEHPDLVLLDIVMPGETGLEVLQSIGTSPQSVVMISSITEQQVMDQVKQFGVKHYINKPFDAQQVVEVLNSLWPASSAPQS